jgi:hypothetical protein
MTERTEEFRLTPEEFSYVKDLLSRDELREFLPRIREHVPSGNIGIRLNRAEAERIRDYLTTQLAAVGFDEEYRANPRGQMIEELIDRFCVR